jgi:hypothetical protein
MGTSLVKRSTIEQATDAEPDWLTLLVPKTAVEAERARQSALASRHVWADRLQLALDELMAWFRSWQGFAVSRTVSQRDACDRTDTVHGIALGKRAHANPCQWGARQ